MTTMIIYFGTIVLVLVANYECVGAILVWTAPSPAWNQTVPLGAVGGAALVQTAVIQVRNGTTDYPLRWNYTLLVGQILTITTFTIVGDTGDIGLVVNPGGVGESTTINNVKDYQTRFRLQSDKKSSTLTIIKVYERENVTFQCKLQVGANQWAYNVQIDVTVPPSISDISGKQNVTEGQNVTLVCTASGYPAPNITWTRLSDNSTVTMPLINIRRQDEGGYRCTADNSVGIPATRNTSIFVHYQPNITSISGNQTVNESDVVSLKCEADGNPTPTRTWTRLSDNSVITMPFTITGKQDEDSYRCTADNDVGNPASSDVFITVQYHRPGTANVTTNLTNDTVVLNEPFNLMCRADANPPAHYRLYKQQQPLTTITDIQAVATFTTSVGERIKQVTYSCTPFNSFGAGPSDTASITVHFSPSATSSGRNETVPLRTPVTFTCPVDGNPPPSVTWYKGTEPSGTELSSRKEFEFTPTSLSDTGLYTCFASNYLGNINVSFGLEVVEGPKSTTPPPTLSKERTHSGELPVEKINGNKSEYREEYNDLNNDVTKQLTDPFKKKMDETFANEPNYEKTEVTKLRNGSVIVSFNLIFTTPVTTNEAFAKLRSAIINGTFGPFQVGALTVVPTPTTTPTKPASDADHCDESFFKKEDCSVKLAVAVGISVAAVLLIAIIAVAVGCWIRKKRKCRKDTRIAHHPGCEEQRLKGGDPNAQVNNGYAETGPPSANSTEKAAAAVPDYTVVDKSTKKKKKKQDEEKPPEYAVEDKSKKKKKNEKVDDTYAKVDMSKKRSKKKPRPGEDVVYADLGDINGTSQMPAVATSPKAQLHPLKRPEGYEGTQYADITQFLKGDATLPKDEKQGTEMKEKDEKTDRAGGENAPKGTLM